MREIEFRYSLRTKDTKRYCEWYFTLEEIERGIFKKMFDNKYELLGKDQYIGFKDKNNDRIYEGDIVEDYIREGKDKIKFIIFWCDVGFELGTLNQKNNEIDYYDYVRNLDELTNRNRLEIIGNIYENLDLLKERK